MKIVITTLQGVKKNYTHFPLEFDYCSVKTTHYTLN